MTAGADRLEPLHRPTREVALRFAREAFLAGERVDMQLLASSLGVGRTTLYRWVGDREQVMGEVLAALSRDVFAGLDRRAHEAAGIDRALLRIRGFIETTADFEPLRAFVTREPTLALKVLMAPDGAVARALRDIATESLVQSFPDRADRITPQIVEIYVQIATALEWVPILIGDEPETERAVELCRTLVTVALDS